MANAGISNHSCVIWIKLANEAFAGRPLDDGIRVAFENKKLAARKAICSGIVGLNQADGGMG